MGFGVLDDICYSTLARVRIINDTYKMVLSMVYAVQQQEGSVQSRRHLC